MPVGGIADQEDAAESVAIGKDRLEAPVADLVDADLEIVDAERGTHATDRVLVVEGRWIVGRRGKAEDPFIGPLSPVGTAHLDQHAAADRATAIRVDEPVDADGGVRVEPCRVGGRCGR